MAVVNHARKEINAKIVYCGPAGSGKGTSITAVFNRLKPELRGELKTMEVRRDRILFFDFAPPATQGVKGYGVRFHIYAVTGGLAEASTLKVVAKGADGIIFVADSGAAAIEANIRSMTDLRESLQAYGQSIEDIPYVLQLNKQDLGTVPASDLESILSPGYAQVVPSIATKGDGVLAALSAVIRQVFERLQELPLDEGAPPAAMETIRDIAAEEAAPETAEEVGEPLPAEEPEPVPDVPVSEVEQPVSSEEKGVYVPEVSLGSPFVEAGVLKVPVHVHVEGAAAEYVLTIGLHRKEEVE